MISSILLMSGSFDYRLRGSLDTLALWKQAAREDWGMCPASI